jgi:hypothetical protein
MSYKNIIIIGAGGNLGPPVLKAFLSSSFNTSVLSREGSNSTFPSGVNVIHANYDDPESLEKALQGQDAVVSLVGGAALGDQEKLIDASIAAGVKRFFPSEFGSDTPNPRTREVVPLFSAKTGAVAYLKSKESAISWTSVITGPFFDWGLKVGFLGFNLQDKTFNVVVLYIGKALVAALVKADQTKNQYVYVSEFQISQNELLKLAEKVTGEEFTVKKTTFKEHVALGNKLLSEGNHAGLGPLIQSITFGDERLGDLSKNGLWNERLGLEVDSIEDSIKTGFAGKLLHEA